VTPPEPPPTQTLLIAKHPAVRLKPTFEVDVAEPEIVRPESVVVPNPSPATVRNLVVLDDDATSKTGFDCDELACTASRAYGVVVPTPTRPSS
jgi:hypothetical protein